MSLMNIEMLPENKNIFAADSVVITRAELLDRIKLYADKELNAAMKSFEVGYDKRICLEMEIKYSGFKEGLEELYLNKFGTLPKI